MTDPHVPTAADLHRAGQQSLLLVPALLSTVLSVALIVLALLMDLVPAMLFDPERDVPELTYLPPTAAERAIGLAVLLVPVLLVAGLLAFTWRYRARGCTRLTWLFGSAAVLVAGLALLG